MPCTHLPFGKRSILSRLSIAHQLIRVKKFTLFDLAIRSVYDYLELLLNPRRRHGAPIISIPTNQGDIICITRHKLQIALIQLYLDLCIPAVQELFSR